MDILIFEDDMAMGALAESCVTGWGYSCKLINHGREALAAVRDARPCLVILDIMMPGMDGLSICRRLRLDPETKTVKIVVASAKNPDAERRRALGAGADGFLRKPYQLAEFEEIVRLLAGAAGQYRPPPETPAARITVWGCRGFSKEPLPPSAIGRNTSCVSIECSAGQLFIFDAGTGIIPCAERLLSASRSSPVTLFLTHYHPDHVQGLYALGGRAGVTLRVAGPDDHEMDLRKLLQGTLAAGGAAQPAIEPILLYEQGYALGPKAKLEVSYAQHPTTTLAYALDLGGRKIVYCPDSELGDADDVQFSDYEEKLTRFCAGADLLIHDAQYAPEDYARAVGMGHSAWPAALRLARQAAAKRLLLFHHAPHYSDERLEAVEKEAQAELEQEGARFSCALAREGATVELP